MPYKTKQMLSGSPVSVEVSDVEQWEITKDCIEGGTEHDAKGTQGPREFQDGIPMPFRFRMRDDDGEVYYYGKCSHDGSFAPLDDFGLPNAGATSIEYRNEAGEYIPL